MRRYVVLLLLASLSLPLMVRAQARTRAQLEADLGWTCPPGMAGKTLSVWNWPVYIAEETIPSFEILCDVQVNYDVYTTNEEVVARLELGNPGFDVVIPTHFFVPIMAELGLIMPLNLELIPNFANLSAAFQERPYDPGNIYSVPYQWGTLGIGYNRQYVSEAPTSWDDFFNYAGPVTWFEDNRTLLGIALKMLGHDPNSADPEEIAAARDYLIAHNDNVVALAIGNSQQLLANGEAHMVVDNNAIVYLLQVDCACEDYAYVIPEEGSYIWVDNMAIPVDAPEPELAHAFMDYLLAPQVAAYQSNFLALATPNQAAIDQGLIDPAMLENPAIYPDEAMMQRLFYVQIDEASQPYYIDAWDEVKVSITRR